MKLKSLLAAAALTLSGLSAQAAIIPYGLQADVSQSTVDGWGWNECHRSSYNRYAQAIDMSGCSGDYFMMGVYDKHAGIYQVLGAGEYDIAVGPSHAGMMRGQLDNWSNGLNWYHSSGRGSWGFTTANDIYQYSADIRLRNSNYHGLSLHTSDTWTWHPVGGWAWSTPGEIGYFNGRSHIERVFFTANATAVPEPSTLALLGIGVAGLVLRRRRSV